jgi:hypothetical protein
MKTLEVAHAVPGELGQMMSAREGRSVGRNCLF